MRRMKKTCEKFVILLGLFIGISGSESDVSKSPEPVESLPPDTFRKLAAALYQRGDKAENRLTRKYFYNTNVTCNDGSVAGYYMRRNLRSKKWIVFLEGGWYCQDAISCESRWARLKSLMSSHRWPAVKTAGGILSSDYAENPHFADANHILVPYCSSDSWSGTSAKGETNSRFAFMGKSIITEVINELAYFEDLLQGTELYLAGSSSGGTGVLINVDDVAKVVKNLGGIHLKVKGISDSGWFLDSNPFSPRDQECDEQGNCSPVGTVRKGTKLWKSRVNSQCEELYKDEIWNCFFGYKIYPLISSPLFIFQWQFDEAQMIADNVGAPVTKAQWNFIHSMGDQLRATFSNVSAVFSPACISHSVLTKHNWARIEIDGVTLPEAIGCWAKSYSAPELKLEIQDQIKVNILSPIEFSKSRGGPSMLADAPQYIYSTNGRYKKLAGNLIRSIADPTENNDKNSISNRLKNEQLDLSNNKKNVSNRKRRNRRRRRRLLKQKCKRNPNAACSELVKSLNSDLVRSLDRRSNRKRSRQQQRKEASQKRKREKRRRQRRRERRKKLRSKSTEHKKPRQLKTRSVPSSEENEGECSHKLVDTCSWPQCNRSCPKLRNPVTGEEMDFLELLKSFGLDMKNVARALGVDFATLNNMDKDVLLHLLTSQPNG